MEHSKLQLAYGQVPKVLLLGNGINRAYGFASWDELIESIRTKDLSDSEKENVKNIPYPLQPVILTGDHLGTHGSFGISHTPLRVDCASMVTIAVPQQLSIPQQIVQIQT